MQSDKMCPVTLGNHKTKTPIGRHPWQPPTPAGFEQGVPWRSPCEHSNSSRIRAHAMQNAVRQNAFRYLKNKNKSLGRHPWQTPTPAGFQRVPWRSPCETLEQQQASSPCPAKCSPTKCSPLPLESIGIHKTRMQAHRRQKLWISSRILCNNFLGALPLTPNEGSADMVSCCVSTAPPPNGMVPK